MLYPLSVIALAVLSYWLGHLTARDSERRANRRLGSILLAAHIRRTTNNNANKKS